jgi:hypothetical protein
MNALRPAMQGAPGQSPLTQAAIEQWKIQTQPILQQQMALSGYGHSPQLGAAMGSSLAEAMPQFLQADIANRLQSAQMAQGMIPLDLQGRQMTLAETIDPARLSADIANQEAMRQIQYGQLSLGAAQLQQQQQQLALQATQGAGGLQRDIAQAWADAQQAERLRQQGLAEQSTTGLFGGTTLPPTLQQTSKTKSSSSK